LSKIQAPIVVSDFQEESLAIRSIDDLTRAGFSSDQIMVAKPGEELAFRYILNNLEKVGMPENEIKYCERQFQAKHILIAVRHDGRHWATAAILYGSRIHKYFKRLEGHEGAFPVSPSNGLSDELPFQMLIEKISGAQPSWMKLLIDSDLDKLLDQFD